MLVDNSPCHFLSFTLRPQENNGLLFVLLAFPYFPSCFKMQTEKVRLEYSEDMSIISAFSIVFERIPELRFDENNNLLK